MPCLQECICTATNLIMPFNMQHLPSMQDPWQIFQNSPTYGRMDPPVKCCGLAYLKQVREHRDLMFIFLLHRHLKAGASTSLIQHWLLLMTRRMMCVILPISKIFPAGWFYQNTSQ